MNLTPLLLAGTIAGGAFFADDRFISKTDHIESIKIITSNLSIISKAYSTDLKMYADRSSAQLYTVEIMYLEDTIDYLEDQVSTREITEAGERRLQKLKRRLDILSSTWVGIASEYGE